MNGVPWSALLADGGIRKVKFCCSGLARKTRCYLLRSNILLKTCSGKIVLRRIKDRDCTTYTVLCRDRVGLEI